MQYVGGLGGVELNAGIRRPGFEQDKAGNQVAHGTLGQTGGKGREAKGTNHSKEEGIGRVGVEYGVGIVGKARLSKIAGTSQSSSGYKSVGSISEAREGGKEKPIGL